MFVCLCNGVTSHVVTEVVANGARTSKQIAEACGAGGDWRPYVADRTGDVEHAPRQLLNRSRRELLRRRMSREIA